MLSDLPSHSLVMNQQADYRFPLEMASVDSRQLRAMMSVRFKACWATKFGRLTYDFDKDIDGDTFDALISKVAEKDCVIFNSFVAELLKIFELSDAKPEWEMIDEVTKSYEDEDKEIRAQIDKITEEVSDLKARINALDAKLKKEYELRMEQRAGLNF